VGFICLEEREMKNFLIAYLFVLFLYPLSVSAQHPNVERYVDILEPGNPGGWGNSLKTWDMEYSMKAGDTVEFDVWLGDTGGGFWEGSYFATYDPSQLSMFDVEAYDGVSFPGPWPPENILIIPDAGGAGTYMVDLISVFVECVQPDSDGHMILSRGWLKSEACGDTTITFHDIPAV
jgi:hypothetical protein